MPIGYNYGTRRIQEEDQMRGRIDRLVGYFRMGGFKTAVPLLRSLLVDEVQTARIQRTDLRHPLWIRVRTSDFYCFQQIFAEQQYALDVRFPPRTIIDAGANIGLASIYFANLFPEARVVAVEPESNNFDLLKENCRQYRHIESLRAALWAEDTELDVCDIGNGHWGFVTRARNDDSAAPAVCENVRGITLSSLFEEFGISKVDILKVDIEGSEKEVFADKPEWLERVEVVIIETHDWLRPGCREIVDAATRDFERRWQQGENLVVARKGACVAGPRGIAASSTLH